MKAGLLLAGLAAMLFQAAPAPAQDPNFHLFLCFGQSNMDGFPGLRDEDRGPVDERFRLLPAVDFPQSDREKGEWCTATPPLCRPSSGIGPADSFGRTLVDALPEGDWVGVIVVAVPGGKIEAFDSDKVEAYAKDGPDWLKNFIREYDGDPYQRLVDLGRKAQKDGVIRGILLHQGESNNGDPEWPEKVKTVYSRLLKDLDLSAKDVPLIAGEMVGKDEGGKCAEMNEIIARLPETIPTAHVVSSHDCKAVPDGLHFSPAGYRKLGGRYAKVVLEQMPASAKE